MTDKTPDPCGSDSSTEFGAWQPIETAPKDGSRLLLFWPLFGNNEHQEFGCWDTQPHNNKPKPFWSGDMERVYGIAWYRTYTPSHWMPPPKAPNTEAQRAAAGGPTGAQSSTTQHTGENHGLP